MRDKNGSIELYSNFIDALNNLDKEKCASLIINALEENLIDIPDLYQDLLKMSLSLIASNEREQRIGIWEEHVQSAIVRSVIELTYPYIIKQRDKNNDLHSLKAIVFCQEEEYHEIGARMVTDFLTLLGFDASFIGANTPKAEVYKAINKLSPDLVCISVTNYFHLMTLKDLINELRDYSIKETRQFKILIGGHAIENTPNAKNLIEPDFFANTYSDLERIRGELV
jgi:methanogenic corrinoid protein MtbC1